MGEIQLFTSIDLRLMFQKRESEALQHVENIDAEKIMQADMETLSETIFGRYKLDRLVLHIDKKKHSSQETKIDVRYDKSRHIVDKTKPFVVDGIKITTKVPFSGNVELFHAYIDRPSFGNAAVDIVNIEGGECDGYLVADVSVPNDKIEQLDRDKATNTAMFALIESNVRKIDSQLAAFNKLLGVSIRNGISIRKSNLEKHSKLMEELDISKKGS